MLQIVKGQCLALSYRDYCASQRTQAPLNQELHTMQIKKEKSKCSFRLFSPGYSIAGSEWANSKIRGKSSVQLKTVGNLIWRFIGGEFDVATFSDSLVAIAVCFSLCHYMAVIQMHTVYRNRYLPSSLCFLDSSCLLLWATTSSGTLSKSLVCRDQREEIKQIW